MTSPFIEMFMRSQEAGELVDRERWIEGFRALREHTAAGPLGLELVDIDDSHVVMEFDISDATRQPLGLLHGGVSLLVAEECASLHSVWGADLSKEAPVGLEVSGSHMRGAREGRVRATATVLRRSRRFVVHEVEVIHVDTGKQLCAARVTNYLKPHEG